MKLNEVLSGRMRGRMNGPSRSTKAMVLKKILVWLIFGVAFALLPVIVNALNLATRGHGSSFPDLVGRGELLLTAAALCATATGDLLSTVSQLDSVRLALAGLNLLMVAVASLWFGSVASAYLDGATVAKAFVCWGSTAVLVFSLITSTATVAVTHAGKP
jgi:hypothetical protein